MIERYVNTFLADKSDLMQKDIRNILSISNGFDNDIIKEFLIKKKKLRFSYRVIGSFKNRNYLEIILIGRTIISQTFYYDDFIKYQRNEILNRLIG